MKRKQNSKRPVFLLIIGLIAILFNSKDRISPEPLTSQPKLTASKVTVQYGDPIPSAPQNTPFKTCSGYRWLTADQANRLLGVPSSSEISSGINLTLDVSKDEGQSWEKVDTTFFPYNPSKKAIPVWLNQPYRYRYTITDAPYPSSAYVLLTGCNIYHMVWYLVKITHGPIRTPPSRLSSFLRFPRFTLKIPIEQSEYSSYSSPGWNGVGKPPLGTLP